MNITLNGKARPTGAHSLLDLVAEVTGRSLADSGQPSDGKRLGVAAALNSDVVPRTEWAARPLQDGDDVELVTAVQGG